jgi:hypothetical protein
MALCENSFAGNTLHSRWVLHPPQEFDRSLVLVTGELAYRELIEGEDKNKFPVVEIQRKTLGVQIQWSDYDRFRQNGPKRLCDVTDEELFVVGAIMANSFRDGGEESTPEQHRVYIGWQVLKQRGLRVANAIPWVKEVAQVKASFENKGLPEAERKTVENRERLADLAWVHSPDPNAKAKVMELRRIC